MNSTYSSVRSLILFLALVFTFTFGASPVMANLFGKSELSGAWKERFQDGTKLKAYTDKGIKVTLDDVTIGKYDLTDAIFDGAAFRDNEWNETTGKNITFTNTIFRNNTFNSVEFTGANLTNVTFEDSEFNGTSFYLSQLTGVKFIRCKFQNKSDFSTLKNSTVEFDHSTIDHTSFAKSHATLTFRNSTLNSVRLIDLILPSTLTFENSILKDIDMDRSKLAKLVMDGVTGGKGNNGFNGGNITEVEIRNSDITLGLQEGTLGKVSIVSSNVRNNFESSNIKELHIINCKAMESLGFYESKIDTLQISNCPINELDTSKSTIQNFSIEKSSIVNSEFKKMNVKNFILTDVSLDGQLDFSNAQVENLITKNITKGSGLNLKLTGSNVKF